MIEKLPETIGEALRDQRAGLEKVAYQRVKARTGKEPIQIHSTAFEDYQPIPMRFTADGEGMSPPLEWNDVPEEAVSLVLMVEDPDAPSPQPFVHAIVVGLPPRDGALHQGALSGLMTNLKLGRNSYLQAKWLPPDPPRGHGVHRYAFQIFALGKPTRFSDAPGRDEVEEELRRSAIAAGYLVGTYERKSSRG